MCVSACVYVLVCVCQCVIVCVGLRVYACVVTWTSRIPYAIFWCVNDVFGSNGLLVLRRLKGAKLHCRALPHCCGSGQGNFTIDTLPLRRAMGSGIQTCRRLRGGLLRLARPTRLASTLEGPFAIWCLLARPETFVSHIFTSNCRAQLRPVGCTSASLLVYVGGLPLPCLGCQVHAHRCLVFGRASERAHLRSGRLDRGCHRHIVR